MKYNYHMHTPLCNHSNTEIDILVQTYIKSGFKEIGIADHIPYQGQYATIDYGRMKPTDLDQYFAQIKAAQIKYQDQIKILIGFESEYFPSEKIWYQKLLALPQVDYLILGVHRVENFDPKNDMYQVCTTPKALEKYGLALEKGMRTGLFLYLVHPDSFMKIYPQGDQHCAQLAKQICDLALELDFPLGFNMHGIGIGKVQFNQNERYIYPIYQFGQIARQKGVKILLETDVHDLDELANTNNLIQKTGTLIHNGGLTKQVIARPSIHKYKAQVKKLIGF